jgi:hypothetical protein
MKVIIIIFVFFQFLNLSIFANDYDNINDIIQNTIGELIEWKYINKSNFFITPSIVRDRTENVNNLDSIHIYIFFNAGVYDLRNYFNEIIENKLIVELKNILSNYDISISLFYPFSIIIKNYFNYEFDEKLNIINEIEKNTHGIIIENLFQNSMYGYFEDIFFCNIVKTENRVNQLINNNFNIFLEILYKYYDKGNIINH